MNAVTSFQPAVVGNKHALSMPSMIYAALEGTEGQRASLHIASQFTQLACAHPMAQWFMPAASSNLAAHAGMILRMTKNYGEPSFGITQTVVDGVEVAVKEDVVLSTPFMDIIHFKRDIPPERDDQCPNKLLVAPMSGHFATLLRGTVEGLLPTQDVYITRWKDPSQIPLSAGKFDLDDYIRHIKMACRYFKGGVHITAVCQPGVPVLAAVALMEEDGDPNVPKSLTLKGSPIDTRKNPTVVNKLATDRGYDWFERNVIATVPFSKPGRGRDVYPGFLQLTGFMAMNWDRHVDAHRKLFDALVEGDDDTEEAHDKFYDEYLAVMDMTAEFYLQTIDTVFVNHHLPKGEMIYTDERGNKRRVRPECIRRVALMTVEGSRDDITGAGQTHAAHDLCPNIPDHMRKCIDVDGAGHYGIFNGRRAKEIVFPEIGHHTRANNLRILPDGQRRHGLRLVQGGAA